MLRRAGGELRRCQHTNREGLPCAATPMASVDYCFWHDPESSEEVAAARKLGGIRRKQEKVVAVSYDIAGISTIPDLRRVLEVAMLDTLAQENTIARARTLGALVSAAAKLYEAEEIDRRLAALEEAVASDGSE